MQMRAQSVLKGGGWRLVLVVLHIKSAIDVLHKDFEILHATHARVYGLRAYTLHAKAHTRRTAKLPI